MTSMTTRGATLSKSRKVAAVCLGRTGRGSQNPPPAELLGAVVTPRQAQRTVDRFLGVLEAVEPIAVREAADPDLCTACGARCSAGGRPPGPAYRTSKESAAP